MSSDEFFEYIENRGTGNPDLEKKFLNLLRTVIGPSDNLSQGNMHIDEDGNTMSQFPNDKLKIFLN